MNAPRPTPRHIAADGWLAKREQARRQQRSGVEIVAARKSAQTALSAGAEEAQHDAELRALLARLDAERRRGQYITVALMALGLLAAVATLVVAWVAPS